jgi:hypothetical protein
MPVRDSPQTHHLGDDPDQPGQSAPIAGDGGEIGGRQVWQECLMSARASGRPRPWGSDGPSRSPPARFQLFDTVTTNMPLSVVGFAFPRSGPVPVR